MYIVKFVRFDGKGNEEYYYQNIKDAKYHFQLFLNDDSLLYSKVLLLDESGSILECLTPIKRG